MLQREEIPGSYWEVSQGAAAVERDPCRRRDHRIRGKPPEPSRGQADGRAAASGGEHRDGMLRQSDRWDSNPAKTAAAVVLNEPLWDAADKVKVLEATYEALI